MLTQIVCTAMGCIVKIEEVKYGFDVCSVTAGVTKSVREQLQSRDLCVETVIKPLKTCLIELAVLQDNLLIWPKLHFLLNLKFEQNITLLFSFTLRN
jgi:hypothetical protein